MSDWINTNEETSLREERMDLSHVRISSLCPFRQRMLQTDSDYGSGSSGCATFASLARSSCS